MPASSVWMVPLILPKKPKSPSTPSALTNVVTASLANIQHLRQEGRSSVQLELNGQINLMPEVAPVFAFHLRYGHVEARAQSAILKRLVQHEVCPPFDSLADRGSTAYDGDHYGLLVRAVSRD